MNSKNQFLHWGKKCKNLGGGVNFLFSYFILLCQNRFRTKNKVPRLAASVLIEGGFLPIILSLPTRVEVEVGGDNCFTPAGAS